MKTLSVAQDFVGVSGISGTQIKGDTESVRVSVVVAERRVFSV